MEFQTDSRYAEVPNREIDAAGRTVVYKAIRAIGAHIALTSHVTRSGERPDHIAYLHYRDPESWWRIADANAVLDPDELADLPGERIIIPRES